MKFFIDSANIEDIKEAQAMGLCDGVTTNPSLVAKTGRPFQDVIHDILEAVKGPVSLEVIAEDEEGMLSQARELADMGEQVVVKLPLTEAGLKVAKQCSSEGIKTNVTLCFSANQALLAAKAGATYISPFVGRLDDVGQTGLNLVEEILTIYENYGFDTEVLVASVRSPQHVLESALLGAHVATVPLAVIRRLFQHPLTDKGLQVFAEDWKNVPNS